THAETGGRQFLVPLTLGAVDEIEVPGKSLRAEYFLPLFTGEFLTVPIIAQPFVGEFIRAGCGPAPRVTREHRQPDDVSAQPLIRNVLKRLLHVGEPPTAGGSNR